MKRKRSLVLSFAAVVLIAGSVTAAFCGYQRLSRSIADLESQVRQSDERMATFIDQMEVRVTSSQGRLPFVTLTASPEHKITRSVIESEFAKSLTWVILKDGEQVLARNAQNETEYQYFRSEPGLYTVYVTAFVDGGYRIVSNVVFYRVGR